jgi:hypothetical protein
MNLKFWLVLGLLAASSIPMACSRGGQATAANHRSATVDRADGTAVGRVVLSAQAAERLGIKLEPMREESSSTSPQGKGTGNRVISAAALVYDVRGGIWVYTAIRNPADASDSRLIYERQAVSVALIRGDVAILSSGPAPGTQVVTVGAAELLGAENGVEGD